jgi:transmembrane sensor
LNSNEHIRQLVDRVINGHASANDLEQLKEFLEDDADGIHSSMIESLLTGSGYKGDEFYDHEKWEDIAEKLMAKASAEENSVPIVALGKGNNRKILIGWAAAIAILFCAAAYLLMQNKESNVLAKQSSSFSSDVMPGEYGAVLQLGNGKKILLDSAKNGQLTTEGNVQIIKKNGSVTYISAGNKDIVQSNIISTPIGRQYQLILDDGTKVWLNAGSSLAYPSRFSGKVREVKMTGEVYFEVAKNVSMPFIVKVNDATIDVLGTQFNINAYADEPLVKTTLAEGSIRINYAKDHELLKPGQQAVIKNGQSGLNIKTANVSRVLSWKNGVFSFDHADIYSIMRQLARWYNVEVEYKGSFDSTDEFGGKILRNVNLSKVLELLQETKSVRFIIDGKKVTVMPYNNYSPK